MSWSKYIVHENTPQCVLEYMYCSGKYSSSVLEYLNNPECEELNMDLTASLVSHIHNTEVEYFVRPNPLVLFSFQPFRINYLVSLFWKTF